MKPGLVWDALLNDSVVILALAGVGAAFAVLAVTGLTIPGIAVCCLIIAIAVSAMCKRITGIYGRGAARAEFLTLLAEGRRLAERPTTDPRAILDWFGRTRAFIEKHMDPLHVRQFHMKGVSSLAPGIPECVNREDVLRHIDVIEELITELR